MKRRKPRRKAPTATVANTGHGAEFVPQVGRMITNFGALELQSHFWIDELSMDDLLVDLALESPFSRRVQLIHQLIDRENVSGEVKERAHAAWNAAADLSEVRNAVAHNPLIWGWRGPERGEPPDFVGIPVVRKLKASKDGNVPLIHLDGLKRAVDAVLQVTQDVEALLGDQSPSPEASRAAEVHGKPCHLASA